MSTAISLCSLVVVVSSVALAVYAFYYIFKEKKTNENDLNVVQRQLKGFALLIVAQIVMIVGMAICAGSLLPYIKDMITA